MVDNQNNTTQEGNTTTTTTTTTTTKDKDKDKDESGRPIFTLTMDPNALEQEINQAAQALHSTVNSLFQNMHSSVFGGLEAVTKEMSMLERTGRDYFDQYQQDHPFFQKYRQYSQQPFPWGGFFRAEDDGPKKRYRITIEELPALEQQDSSSLSGKIFSRAAGARERGTETAEADMKMISKDEDFSIVQGKPGTTEEGKTVITASVAPGLLDWLVFTASENSFLKRMQQQHEQQQQQGGSLPLSSASIRELGGDGDEVWTTETENEKEKRPSLVQRVKRHWLDRKQQQQQQQQQQHHRHDHDDVKDDGGLHHLFTGTSQDAYDQDEERQSRRWPRGRSWGHSESYSQSTVTRPDGSVEQRTMSTIDGETETVVKIQHPDGSVEETITRDGAPNSNRRALAAEGGNNHHGQNSGAGLVTDTNNVSDAQRQYQQQQYQQHQQQYQSQSQSQQQ